MTTYSDDTMELALALWPQYTRETLPPQIHTAVANRVVREQREEQEERDGTAERRRAARLAVIQEHEEQQARATEWEQRHPDLHRKPARHSWPARPAERGAWDTGCSQMTSERERWMRDTQGIWPARSTGCCYGRKTDGMQP